MSLYDSLEMDSVDDPNEVPDGKYAAELVRSQFVTVKSNNGLSLVNTYRITEGNKKGKEVQEWFRLGVNPEFAEDGKTPIRVENTMTPQNKEWYKKRWYDLGASEDEFKNADTSALVGKKVNIGVRTKTADNGTKFVNVNFVELVNQQSQAQGETTGATTGLL